MGGPLEQTVEKFNWIFLQIRIGNECNKITLKCKVDQTAEFVRYLLILPNILVRQNFFFFFFYLNTCTLQYCPTLLTLTMFLLTLINP